MNRKQYVFLHDVVTGTLLSQVDVTSNFRLPDVGRVFAGNFGNGDGTFFCKNGKDMA
jgi:hypothetical protein